MRLTKRQRAWTSRLRARSLASSPFMMCLPPSASSIVFPRFSVSMRVILVNASPNAVSCHKSKNACMHVYGHALLPLTGLLTRILVSGHELHADMRDRMLNPGFLLHIHGLPGSALRLERRYDPIQDNSTCCLDPRQQHLLP